MENPKFCGDGKKSKKQNKAGNPISKPVFKISFARVARATVDDVCRE
jgi:hypothetical protein